MRFINTLLFILFALCSYAVEQVKYPNEQMALYEAHLSANVTHSKVTYIGRTPSMLGVLKPGSIITYRVPSPNEVYTVGQVAIYKSLRPAYPTIVHQIIAVREDAVYFKGTFNSQGDGWISKDLIVGIVTRNFVW